MALLGKLPTIANLTLVKPNTEYSYTFPRGTKKFRIQCRSSNNVIKYSYKEGESGKNFMTVSKGVLKEGGLNTNKDLTIYLQSPSANVVVEILTWTTDQCTDRATVG